jgi:hypothetical protein
MLNADMALVSEFDFVDSETGEVGCLPSNRRNVEDQDECQLASSFDQVLHYATNGDDWIKDFQRVLTKMVNTVGVVGVGVGVGGTLIAVDDEIN